MTKKMLLFMTFILLTSTLMTPIIFSDFSYLAWIDSLFAVSIIITMIGASLYIIEKGFFNPFIHTLKYFMRNFNKRKQIADEIEQKNHDSYEEHHPIDKTRKYPLTNPCLAAGGILLFLSICLSIIQ